MKHLHRLITPLPLALLLAACNGSDTLSSQAEALTAAQCTYQGFHAAAQACFETFNSCQSASGAVLADCRSELEACLPPPPPGSHPGHRLGDGSCQGPDGERPPPMPDGGLPPPPLPDGGLPPPPPPPPPGGHRGPPPLAIDSAALSACRDGLSACLAADATALESCHTAEHACVRDAFRAQFQARCEEGLARCAVGNADAEACARITARCAEGIDGRPPNADGGSCQ